MTSVVIFDLSETLVEGPYSIVRPLAERVGVPEAEILPGLGGEPLVPFLEGRCSESVYWRGVRDQTKWDIHEAELSSMVRDAFRRPIAGMPELLASLSDLRLLLLSDHGREWWAYIEDAHPFLDVFEHRFLSFEMGQTKRQQETFVRVLDACGAVPEECVFIDDLQWNVDRAEAAGIRSHRYTSPEAVLSFLEESGISRRT
jgi:HAD superfamily hydrolase (TIGR01509 family)